MGSLISLIVIVSLSILITKIGAQALIKTGLAKDAAQFQARSAFTGVGFTTRESEKITSQPLRRKIIMTLMLIGNIGIISAIASLMLTFINGELDTSDRLVRIIIIILVILLLWGLSKSNWLENKLNVLIDLALKRFTKLHDKDYVALLKLQEEYEITVITVKKNDWLANRIIRDLKLAKEGVNLIGIEREDGTYLGTPGRETKIQPGDKLTIYGREESLRNLEQRKKDSHGDAEHESAKKKQTRKKEEQKEADKNV